MICPQVARKVRRPRTLCQETKCGSSLRFLLETMKAKPSVAATSTNICVVQCSWTFTLWEQQEKRELSGEMIRMASVRPRQNWKHRKHISNRTPISHQACLLDPLQSYFRQWPRFGAIYIIHRTKCPSFFVCYKLPSVQQNEVAKPHSHMQSISHICLAPLQTEDGRWSIQILLYST